MVTATEAAEKMRELELYERVLLIMEAPNVCLLETPATYHMEMVAEQIIEDKFRLGETFAPRLAQSLQTLDGKLTSICYDDDDFPKGAA